MNLSQHSNQSQKNQLLLNNNLLRVIEDSIVVTDLDGKIIYWNKGAENVFGYNQEEAIGQTPGLLYPDKSEEMFKNDLNKLKKGKDFVGEWEGRKKDGSIVWLNIKMTTMLNDSGKVVGFIGICKDITEEKRMVKELIKSETRYQTIFENSGEGIFLLKDKYIDVNKKVCEIFGYSRGEIIGKSPLDFSPERQPDGRLSEDTAAVYIKQAIQEGYVSFYWQHISKDNKLIDAKITLNRVRIQGESILIAIMQDITEFLTYQKELQYKTEELTKQNNEILNLNVELSKTNSNLKEINRQIETSERKFRVAFKTSPDSININRMSDGLIVEINEGFTSLTGYTEKDVQGKTLLELDIWAHQKDREKLIEILSKEEQVPNLEAEFRRKNGSVATGLMSASIIEIKGEKHILSITRDISERKKQEQLLQKAINKAEESDRLKSAFLANMSHEIRTPLNAILGFGQLMKEKKTDPEKQDKFLDIILTRSKNLLQIINDIIDISKIEANQLSIEIESFSLKKMLYELFAHYEAELVSQNKQNVKLRFQADLSKAASNIISDELRLKQILTNLISNALKFTDKGSVEFGYWVKGEELEFFVNDTGIGIPQNITKQIFERFRQADDSNTREFGGAGLGLSISKQLVEMLGGKIWVESELNKGSTFRFMIPYRPDHDLSQTTLVNDSSLDLSGKKILIVEDDIISMAYLKELLMPTNAKIVEATTGLKAVEVFKSNPDTDLVLMDVNLPIMNGNLATSKIKEIKTNVPVIAQSAFAIPEDKKESYKHGCDEYIIKPIDNKLLFSLIKKLLI